MAAVNVLCVCCLELVMHVHDMYNHAERDVTHLRRYRNSTKQKMAAANVSHGTVFNFACTKVSAKMSFLVEVCIAAQ